MRAFEGLWKNRNGMEKDRNGIEEIIDLLIRFRDERNWKQFHNSKDLALALSIETAELNELFLWKSAEAVNVEKLKEELADVLIFAYLLARNHDFDIREIILNKIKINEKKYPIEKARNSMKKYNEL
jgi:NTP pyrophosphatase (non-canonical NTP hydrolase)